MKMKYNMILMVFMFLNPFLVMSMNSYLGIWINMELNLILFLTFMIMNNLNIYDLSMKYFLINSLSSSIFLFMMMMNYLNLMMIFNFMMNLMMMIKLGMPPFHFWFIDLMMNLNWISCLILSTWQKLIPLIMIFYIFNLNMLIFFIFISMIISVFKGFLTFYLKVILGYSSINHLSWMLITMFYSMNLWIVYYLSYLILSLGFFLMMNKMNLIFMNDFNKINFFFKKKINLIILFSLSGLPPFFGFLIKWFSIYKLIFLNNYLILMFLIMFSLIFLYYYIRLVFNFMFLYINEMKYNFFILIFQNNLIFYLIIYLFSLMNLFFLLFYLN